jgi:1-acyl-sn-glycerol-3-phosphate acyltransferase
MEARRPACQPDPIAEAARRLRAGLVVGVFPEGSRGLHAVNLRRMRLGVARLSLETGCPVVPVGLSYRGRPRKALAAGRPIRRVTIRVGAPVLPDGQDIRRLSTAIGQEIARLSDLPPHMPEQARDRIRIPDHAVGMEAKLIVEGAYDPATDQGGDPCSREATKSA